MVLRAPADDIRGLDEPLGSRPLHNSRYFTAVSVQRFPDARDLPVTVGY